MAPLRNEAAPELASLQDAVPWKSGFRCCRRVTPQARANSFEPSGFTCESGSMGTIPRPRFRPVQRESWRQAPASLRFFPLRSLRYLL